MSLKSWWWSSSASASVNDTCMYYGYCDLPGFSTQPTKVGQEIWSKGPQGGHAHFEECWFGWSFTSRWWCVREPKWPIGSFFQSWLGNLLMKIGKSGIQKKWTLSQCAGCFEWVNILNHTSQIASGYILHATGMSYIYIIHIYRERERDNYTTVNVLLYTLTTSRCLPLLCGVIPPTPCPASTKPPHLFAVFALSPPPLGSSIIMMW